MNVTHLSAQKTTALLESAYLRPSRSIYILGGLFPQESIELGNELLMYTNQLNNGLRVLQSYNDRRQFYTLEYSVHENWRQLQQQALMFKL